MDKENIRSLLSESLLTFDKHYARLVADLHTEMSIYPASFLKTYQIYKIKYFAPTRPVLFYIGFAPGHPSYFLTTNQQNYIQLAQADGVDLSTSAQAGEYATAYLEVTRIMSHIFYQVNTMPEVKFRPALTPDRLKIKEAFELKYAAIIQPPEAEATGGGYSVSIYAVRAQALEKHSLVVGRNGTINDHITILEEELPLVYGI